MSFPAIFSSQVAAIMDVLARAAVAEICKVVEDGSVVLRLEMRRKDHEIQELRKSMKGLEVELCNAQDALISRAVEENQEPRTEDKEQTQAGFLEPDTADSLCKHQLDAADGDDMWPTVKHEPPDEITIQERTDIPAAAAAAANVHFEGGHREDPIWPSAAMQQHLHTPPAHAEQFFAHRNPERSQNSPSTAPEEITNVFFSEPVKVELNVSAMHTEGTTSESIQREPLRRVSRPLVTENQCSQSTLQQAAPSPAEPPVQRSEDHIHSRNNPRVKRLRSVWRNNQKVFLCSLCNKGFPRLSQLEEHEAAHQHLKPFRCLQCGKTFTQKTRMKTHQRVHTGERPFSCQICGKMFSRKDNCMRHERFHSGMRPHICGQCGKSFTMLGKLKKHQEMHLLGR